MFDVKKLIAEGHAAYILDEIFTNNSKVVGIRVEPIAKSGVLPFNLQAGTQGVTYKLFGEDITDAVVYCAGRSFPIGIVPYVYLEGELMDDAWDM